MDSPNRSSRLNKTLYSLPVHCLSDADIELENSRGVMPHFHSPENKFNRFMASMTDFSRSTLRDIERAAPYNSKAGNSSQWPASAPGASRHTGRSPSCCHACQKQQREGCTSNCRPAQRSSRPSSSSAVHVHDQSATIQQALCTTTQKGVPCYTFEAVVAADMLEGQPASPELTSKQPWRVSRVKSYSVAPSEYGYGEAGKTAFHQKYSWYKYHGFAGKGAKTSWASNPTKHVSRNYIPAEGQLPETHH